MTPQSGPESSSRDKMPQRDDLPSGRSLRVVAIGGGTGLSTLLKGLKRFAVAAGTADGGLRGSDRGRRGGCGWPRD